MAHRVAVDGLHVADGLTLPLDAVTRRMAILAMSGAGKSNAAVVLAEAMFDAGIPWVAVDPKGDWWGVRSAGDGREGLPIPVFGGLHGDLPLLPHSGKLMAELIAEHRLTCVLDVSEFDSLQQMYTFLKEFGQELYRRKQHHPAPLHLFLDEADQYMPQSAREGGSLPACLNAWVRVVTKGRNRGLGTTIISQRSATVHKDALFMAEALFALRTAGPRNKGDRPTIAAWFEEHALDGRAIVDLLPTLGNGEALVASPVWLGIHEPQRIQFRQRETHDSGATPDLAGAVEPARLADVDLDALRTRMAAAVAEVERTDPKILQARIRELERELSAVAHEDYAERYQAALDENNRLDAELAEAAELNNSLIDENRSLRIILSDRYATALVLASGLRADVERFPFPSEAVEPARASRAQGTSRVTSSKPGPFLGRADAADGRVSALAAATPVQAPRSADGALTPYQRDLLTAVAQRHPAPSTRAQVATLARKSIKSSAFGPNLRALVDAGYVLSDGQRVEMTVAGFEALGGYEAPPTGPALVDWWLSRLSAGEATFLRAIVAAHPDWMTREEIAAATGRSLTSSAFNPTLRDLVDRDLVETSNGMWRAADVFF